MNKYYSVYRKRLNPNRCQLWLRSYEISGTEYLYILYPYRNGKYEETSIDFSQWRMGIRSKDLRLDLEDRGEFLGYI
jgi:hypothetical protein